MNIQLWHIEHGVSLKSNDSNQPEADPATVPRVVPFFRHCAQLLIAAAPSFFQRRTEPI